MACVEEILRLCRLCLQKQDVKTPIFEQEGDIKEIFLKITTCLPVKVSREDQLPKKICDDCTDKLDSFYNFWKTTVDSEKQLLNWLSRIDKLPAPVTGVKKTESLELKEEVVDPPEIRSEEDVSSDAVNDSEYPQTHSEKKRDTVQTNNPSVSEEPPPKRARRSVTLKKQIQTSESDEDDDFEPGADPKVEEGDSDNSDDADDPGFGDERNNDEDHANIDDQPGPSGVGKSTADQSLEVIYSYMDTTEYACTVCSQIFPTKDEFLGHHMKQFGQVFTCCKCSENFRSCTQLYQHYETHKSTEEPSAVANDQTQLLFKHEKESEIIMVQESSLVSSDLLYILDDSQCVNEVVIEEEIPDSDARTQKPDDLTIVNLEHGYGIRDVHSQPEDGAILVHSQFENDVISLPENNDVVPDQKFYDNLHAKPRMPQPKKRHDKPDFSATNYLVLNANEEVDAEHFKCLRCEQLFISKFGFFRHIERGKCYINNCDVCPATFEKNSDFYEHYSQNHIDRAICHFCFRTFMYEKNVKEHMMRHLDQFRHRCEECNKGFYTIREYRNHYKNRHMGIRYKCQSCERSFADEYYFKRHMAAHAKSKT